MLQQRLQAKGKGCGPVDLTKPLLLRRQVPEECPAAIAQLIQDCMGRPPDERPSARQAYDIIRSASAAALQARGRQRPACSFAPLHAPYCRPQAKTIGTARCPPWDKGLSSECKRMWYPLF